MDITMCNDKKCKLKNSCLRFTAKPSVLQPYFSISPYDKVNKICEMYYTTNTERIVDTLNKIFK